MSHDSIFPPIPIGVEDYKEIIDNKSAYIDKTLLIKEFWQDGGKVILTPRPRRFGKTLNLSMLKYFFEKTDQNNANIFENTNIWTDPEFRDLQGQFPVIFLTFKDIKVDSWKEAYEEFINLLTINIEKLLSPIYPSLTPVEQKWYARLVDRSATEADYSDSLLYATVILERHYQKKVIILIDEYDAPIIEAYIKNYYEKMIKFMRSLLSKALKTNSALQKAFLTGITRIAKEDIFSGLNNLSIYTVLNVEYSDKFGFTQKEVDQLLVGYDLVDKKDEIKNWYDGYMFGETNIYNPWSLLNCIKNKGIFKAYWVNTSDNKLVKNIIANSNEKIKKELELLLQNNVIINKEIDEGVTFSDFDNNDQEPWSFLLFTGYLTTTSHTIIDDNYYYTLAIPNKEIEKLYQNLIFQALSTNISFAKLKELFEALITGDKKIVEQYLQEFIAKACSSLDVAKNDLERNIHMFVLGLLAGLSSRYIIQSNRSPHLSAGTPNCESGDGRYDIMLMPRNPHDPGILIEFKRTTEDDNATLATLAQKALEQIKNLNYKTQLKDFGYQGSIFCYGIAVCGKKLIVAMEII